MSVHSTEEIWKDIPGYEDEYQVSDAGRVKALTRCVIRKNRWGGEYPRFYRERILKPLNYSSGHQFVHLPNGRESVHVLVLLAFVGPCPPGMECRHFPNRNPADNRLVNLQWGTPKQNQADKVSQGTHQHGEKNMNSKLSNVEAQRLRKLRAKGWLLRELALLSGLSESNVSDIVNNKSYRM